MQSEEHVWFRKRSNLDQTTLGYLLVITMNNSYELSPEEPWPTLSNAGAKTSETVNASIVKFLENGSTTVFSMYELQEDLLHGVPTAPMSHFEEFERMNATPFSSVPNDFFINGTNLGMEMRTKATYNWYFLLLLVFVVTGGLGNVLVCLAICLEKKLQNLTNYFLLSLAVADLLVSMVVMPFGISSGLYGGQWPFGTALCNVYVTFDVLCCSSSILHMTFISMGRYMGIRNPLKSRNQNASKKVVLGKVVLVWMFAMVITSPITVLGTIDKQNIQPSNSVCSINSRFFWIFGSLGAFYIPMIIMVTTYVLTVKLLQKQAKFGIDDHKARRLMVKKTAGGKMEGRHSKIGSDEDLAKDKNGMKKVSSINDHSQIIHTYDTKIQLADRSVRTMHSRENEVQTVAVDSSAARRVAGRSSRNMRLFSRPGRRKNSFGSGNTNSFGGHSVATEQKASKVLGLVFFSFVIFWAPFFVLNILFPVLSPQYFTSTQIDTCLWLGYISSTINPIIYTVFNKTFRHAFLRLLMCRCRRYAYRHRHRKHGYTFAGRNTTIVDRLSRTCVKQNDGSTTTLPMRSTMSTIMLQSPSSTFITSTSGRESSC